LDKKPEIVIQVTHFVFPPDQAIRQENKKGGWALWQSLND
jgi:hypothetical protein